MSRRYDYIVAGAGASGLTLAAALGKVMAEDGRVLVVDASLAAGDEKTWCFWHRGDPPWAELVEKSWDRAEVEINGKIIRDRLVRHSYHCIRSKAFRRRLLDRLERDPRFELLEAEIRSLDGGRNEATLRTAEASYRAEYIFQSCFHPPPLSEAAYPLRQHFLGWDIRCGDDRFEPGRVILMDFDESFEGGVAFIYLLPWSGRRALVEYTVFSRELLERSRYEKKIELYLFNKYGLKRLEYEVMREERGVVPMDDRSWPGWYAPRVLNMGGSGGLTKATTGYTFSRIQRHVRLIAARLREGRPPAPPPPSPARYMAYDLWLLHIISEEPDKALGVFDALFSNNAFDAVFEFLGEESSVAGDLKIMASVPSAPFLKALWKSRGRLWSRWRDRRRQVSYPLPSR